MWSAAYRSRLRSWNRCMPWQISCEGSVKILLRGSWVEKRGRQAEIVMPVVRSWNRCMPWQISCEGSVKILLRGSWVEKRGRQAEIVMPVVRSSSRKISVGVEKRRLGVGEVRWRLWWNGSHCDCRCNGGSGVVLVFAVVELLLVQFLSRLLSARSSFRSVGIDFSTRGCRGERIVFSSLTQRSEHPCLENKSSRVSLPNPVRRLWRQWGSLPEIWTSLWIHLFSSQHCAFW